MTARYDAHAKPQRRAAEDLLAFTGPLSPCAILEPGCGTGLYTRLLLAAFPRAEVLGLDVSTAMLQEARRKIADPRAAFLVADAEDFHKGRYDLITSNATFQWFTDLPRGLAGLADLLVPGGALSFSFFGPETYRELDWALRQVFGEEVGVSSRRFTPRAELLRAVHALFGTCRVEERCYTQTFPNLGALLRSIRYTGTRGRPCGPEIHWTPGRLAQVERAYCGQYGKIQASYQVILCTGQR
ncbi:MAG: methyltransferase domain-containing protein [Armatimonadota bacterium]